MMFVAALFLCWFLYRHVTVCKRPSRNGVYAKLGRAVTLEGDRRKPKTTTKSPLPETRKSAGLFSTLTTRSGVLKTFITPHVIASGSTSLLHWTTAAKLKRSEQYQQARDRQLREVYGTRPAKRPSSSATASRERIELKCSLRTQSAQKA